MNTGIEAELDDGAFIDSVKDRYREYLQSKEIPFKNLGSPSLRESKENLNKALYGEHGGLRYADYRRFVGILGEELVSAVKASIPSGEGWEEEREEKPGESGFLYVVRVEKVRCIVRNKKSSVVLLDPEIGGSDSLLEKLQKEYDPYGLLVEFDMAAANAILDTGIMAGKRGAKEGTDWLTKFRGWIVSGLESDKDIYIERVKADRFSLAASRGDMEAMGDLRTAHFDNILDGWGAWKQDRPLFEAAKYGQVEAAKALLGGGAWANEDLTSRKIKGLSLLGQAAFYGQSEFFEFMLTRGADPRVLLDQKVEGVSVFDILENRAGSGKDKASARILDTLKGVLKGVLDKRIEGSKKEHKVRNRQYLGLS